MSHRSKAPLPTTSRRRLRIFDEDDEDGENIDPYLSSDPLLPSSIHFPTTIEEGNASEASERDEDEDPEEYSAGSGSYRTEYSGDDASPGSPADRPVKSNRVNERFDRMEETGGHRSPPGVAENAGRSEEVDEDVLSRLRKHAKGAAKRTVKNPRPKLDPQRLLSDKGLPALLNDFKKVHFRGKGFEFQDLDRLLFVYKAWANRLVPKANFPEVIERLEKAGTRREIRVALHRLRTGIWPPYASAEHVSNDDDSDAQPQQLEDVEDEELAWERALREVPRPNVVPAYESMDTSSFIAAPTEQSEPADSLVPSTSGPSTTPIESAEARAERNRQLAVQRLEAHRKLSNLSQTNTVSPNVSLLKSAFVASLVPDANPSNASGPLHSLSSAVLPTVPRISDTDAPDC